MPMYSGERLDRVRGKDVGSSYNAGWWLARCSPIAFRRECLSKKLLLFLAAFGEALHLFRLVPVPPSLSMAFSVDLASLLL